MEDSGFVLTCSIGESKKNGLQVHLCKVFESDQALHSAHQANRHAVKRLLHLFPDLKAAAASDPDPASRADGDNPSAPNSALSATQRAVIVGDATASNGQIADRKQDAEVGEGEGDDVVGKRRRV